MRIAVIADTFPPIRISGAVQMRDLVREFAAQGHDTTVIVPAANLAAPFQIERPGLPGSPEHERPDPPATPPGGPERERRDLSAAPPGSPERKRRDLSAATPGSPERQRQDLSAATPGSPERKRRDLSAAPPGSPERKRRDPSEEQGQGSLTVLRVRTPPTKDVNYVRRTINEMRLPHALLRGMRAAGIPLSGWDGVVWYSPTIFLGPLVKRIRRASGCRSYLILRDIFPEWAVDMGLMGRGLPYRFFKWIEAGQYAVADTIGVQCEANLAYLKRWAERPGRRLEVLENWLSPAPLAGCRIDISKTKLANRKIFVYTGNMGVAQGMDVFLQMVARMRDRKDVGFLFVGRGSEAARYAAEAARQGLDNVLFHDEIEPEEIPGLLAQCHFAMLALDPRHTSHNIPGKFLTYMQAGLPVLARINPGNDLEKVIRHEQVGRVCTGGDAATLQALAEDLSNDSGAAETLHNRAQRLGEGRFSTPAAARQIARAVDLLHKS